MPCPSCEMLTINGVPCHETGCPDAWRDQERECPWCGVPFEPQERTQRFCSEACAADYLD